MAIEEEIHNWNGFRDGLAGEDEKQAFDTIMDLCRIQAAASKSAIQRRHEMLWEYFEHFMQTGEIKTNSV